MQADKEVIRMDMQGLQEVSMFVCQDKATLLPPPSLTDDRAEQGLFRDRANRRGTRESERRDGGELTDSGQVVTGDEVEWTGGNQQHVHDDKWQETRGLREFPGAGTGSSHPL